jgi:hypothetical protein
VKRVTVAAVLLLAAAPAVATSCDAFAPFALPYRVSYGSTALGTGSLSVFPADDAGCYVYRLIARPYAALRWLVGELEEESRFCRRGADIQAQRFRHVESDDPDHSFALQFDWAAQTVSGGTFARADLPADALDPLSLQLHVRQWVCRSVAAGGQLPNEPLGVTLVDRKGVKRYEVRVAARERIEVPAGSFDTVRIDRSDSSRGSTRFWLARDHDYLIVRVQQRRDDRPALRIELAELRKFE